MTEVIRETDSSGTMGLIVGMLFVLVIGVLFFVYGLPLIRQSTSSPQINVPDKIDVNVNNPQQ